MADWVPLFQILLCVLLTLGVIWRFTQVTNVLDAFRDRNKKGAAIDARPQFSLRFILISVAVIAVLAAIATWPNNRFIYSHYIGSYRFGIEIGGEIDTEKNRYRTLITSYYEPPQLRYRIDTFRVPDASEPEFKTILDEESGLVCVYDTKGWGYLAIINTKTNEFFSSIPMPAYTSDTIDWRDEYDLLKSKNPGLPYVEIFENAERRLAAIGELDV